jgi:large subunit ribosomal protein L24
MYMNIKKGDNVIVTTGKDKGKTGKVVHAFPATGAVLIEGVNVKKVHRRSRKGGSKGEIVERATPINVSNVMIIDPKTKKPTRIGYKDVNGKKVRIAKKSGIEI